MYTQEDGKRSLEGKLILVCSCIMLGTLRSEVNVASLKKGGGWIGNEDINLSYLLLRSLLALPFVLKSDSVWDAG